MHVQQYTHNHVSPLYFLCFTVRIYADDIIGTDIGPESIDWPDHDDVVHKRTSMTVLGDMYNDDRRSSLMMSIRRACICS